METVQEEAQKLFPYSRDLRRDFHQHPELGFQEVRTAGIIAHELNNMGLEVTTGVAKTGVVALLDTGKPGPVLLVRSDMDALPISEENQVDYASQNPGVMHACGHDGHMASLLTVARLLVRHKDSLHGMIKFIFQPAEEGLDGAEAMLEAGILENPRPERSLAIHLWNNRPVGWIGLVPGPIMAGSDIFKVKVSGVGGHGGIPQDTVDPVYASAQIITALQSIVSRNIAPQQAAVVSIGKLQAGETHNVIPPYAIMEGTARYFDEEVHQKIVERFKQITTGVGEALGCQVDLEYRTFTPPVVNDPEIIVRLQALAAKDFPDLTVDSTYQTTVSEDMAFIMNQIPGAFILVGSANAEKGLSFGHHHPRFNFDERVLPIAAGFVAAAAEELLKD